jgi:hypothetical protein
VICPRRLPLPTRCDRAGRPLVSALRPVHDVEELLAPSAGSSYISTVSGARSRLSSAIISRPSAPRPSTSNRSRSRAPPNACHRSNSKVTTRTSYRGSRGGRAPAPAGPSAPEGAPPRARSAVQGRSRPGHGEDALSHGNQLLLSCPSIAQGDRNARPILWNRIRTSRRCQRGMWETDDAALMPAAARCGTGPCCPYSLRLASSVSDDWTPICGLLPRNTGPPLRASFTPTI